MLNVHHSIYEREGAKVIPIYKIPIYECRASIINLYQCKLYK